MKLYTSILLAFFLVLAQIGLAQTPVLPSSIDASMRDLQTFVSERAYMSRAYESPFFQFLYTKVQWHASLLRDPLQNTGHNYHNIPRPFDRFLRI